MTVLPQPGSGEAVHLEPPSPAAQQALTQAEAGYGTPGVGDVRAEEQLREVAAGYPAMIAVWAALAVHSLEHRSAVLAYAYARTAYHRGLDQLRKAGWRDGKIVPGAHEPNRAFLSAVAALMRAAAAIGESSEAYRCRDFLLQLDPTDPLAVREASLEASPT